MADIVAKFRFRFGIRSILCLFVVVALLLTFVPKYYEAKYYIPIAEPVEKFNARYVGHRIGTYEAPITPAEIISVLKTEIPKFPPNKWGPEIEQIYSRIVRTKSLPKYSYLKARTESRTPSGMGRHVWYVDLWIVTEDSKAYQVRIRTNNSPAAFGVYLPRPRAQLTDR